MFNYLLYFFIFSTYHLITYQLSDLLSKGNLLFQFLFQLNRISISIFNKSHKFFIILSALLILINYLLLQKKRKYFVKFLHFTRFNRKDLFLNKGGWKNKKIKWIYLGFFSIFMRVSSISFFSMDLAIFDYLSAKNFLCGIEWLSRSLFNSNCSSIPPRSKPAQKSRRCWKFTSIAMRLSIIFVQCDKPAARDQPVMVRTFF